MQDGSWLGRETKHTQELQVHRVEDHPHLQNVAYNPRTQELQELQQEIGRPNPSRTPGTSLLACPAAVITGVQ